MIRVLSQELAYHVNLGNSIDNVYLRNMALSLQEKYPIPDTHWECDTYNTMHIRDVVWSDANIQQLISECTNYTYEFLNEYGTFVHPIYCNDIWFNIAGPGHYQECHNHPHHDFSLVYYIDVPEHSGNLMFDLNNTMMPLRPQSNSTPASFQNYHIYPIASDLIIFRSHMRHMVQSNQSKDLRISIAMNYKFNYK